MLRGSKTPEEIDPAEEQMVQEMVMETFGKFKSVVQAGRDRAASLNKTNGKKLAANWQEYADGRILTGKRAFELGFVDQIGNFQSALDATRQIAGIAGKPHVIRYQEPFSLARVFGLGATAKTLTPNTVKVDLGFDLPRMQAGRLYFLAPTALP
jgi:protease-4